jgi:signal transduction histidine kinase
MPLSRETLRLLAWAGIAVWLAIGGPMLTGTVNEAWRFRAWLACYLVFGVAFLASVRQLGRGGRGVPLLLAIQGAAVVGTVALLCHGYEGTLLVLVAMLLGATVGRRAGLLWITVQTLALAAGIAFHWSQRPAFLLTPPYFGFQVLAFLVLSSLARETRGREELARSHAELTATQDLLAQSARLAERLRISRELHDAVGHHLVALSLNLEAAIHRHGPADEELATARSLARLVLTDLGEMVATMRREGGVDLRPALALLARDIPRPRVHLEAPAALTLTDPERAHALLRCCQEAITNAVKHSGAENLWLAVARENGAAVLQARDDGRGAQGFVLGQGPGHGLAGMRERLAPFGGTLAIDPRPGAGFCLTLTLPLGEGAPPPGEGPT